MFGSHEFSPYPVWLQKQQTAQEEAFWSVLMSNDELVKKQ
jgi:hypothetical protein